MSIVWNSDWGISLAHETGRIDQAESGTGVEVLKTRHRTGGDGSGINGKAGNILDDFTWGAGVEAGGGHIFLKLKFV